MQPDPVVSVLLTAYNRAGYLKDAIDSVLAQTYTDYELLILDDNSSTPEQLHVLMEYWNRPGVRIYKDDIRDEYRKATVRYATMINLGLSLARGKYITYLCDDDLYFPDRLERMVALLDKGECQVVYGDQEMHYAEEPRGLRSHGGAVLTDAYCNVDHSSVMHTRAVIEEAGGWDDHPDHWRQADAEFFRKLNAHGYDFHNVPGGPTDVHRFHPGSVQSGGYP